MQTTQHLAQKDEDVGRITTPARIENYDDATDLARGKIPAEAVRKLEVADALVDTGASTIGLPGSMIRALGLRPISTRPARTAAGTRDITIYSPVLVYIQDRNAIVRPMELPEGSPVLIGQIPLEEMDLVPFPKEQKLLPNPAHGNEWVIEAY